MTLTAGDLLHQRYQIVEVLGQGGMGAIYRALDTALGVEVAVKENLFFTDEHARQFHREATILAGLRHPHLPLVTDHFTLEGQGQYLVMDFIPGEDLRQRLARTGCLPENEALLIGIAVCAALEYLHSRVPPIVHRDIKPGNIKITPQGQVYLVDFGLAKVAHSGQATTVGAQSLTPGYAPPEQYGQGTDQRSDIYALCATLYAVLAGCIPEDALSRAMGSKELLPLRQRNPRISAGTAAAIERGMQIDASLRFQTAAELRQALLLADTAARQQVASAAEILVSPPPAVNEATQVVDRSTPRPPAASSAPPEQPAAQTSSTAPFRWWRPAEGAAIFALLAVLAFLFGPRLFGGLFPAPAVTPTLTQAASPATVPASLTNPTSEPDPATIPPRQPTATLEPTTSPAGINIQESPGTPGSLETPGSPETQVPSPAPTALGGGGGLVAYVSDQTGQPQIWVMHPDGTNQRAVTTLPDGACQPDWSPDGRQLVFVSPCRGRQDQYPGAGLFLVTLDGSQVTPLRTTPGGDYEPAWSPDGEQIAFTSLRDGRPHIYLYHLADNTVTGLSRPSSYDSQPAWSPDGQWLAFTTTRLGPQQIWLMRSDGSEAREFSNQASSPAANPLWSPDGEVLFFSSGSLKVQLIAKRPSDRINEFPVNPELFPVWDADLPADGAWFVFESVIDGNWDIYRATRNGTGRQALTDGAGQEFDPVWQP